MIFKTRNINDIFHFLIWQYFSSLLNSFIQLYGIMKEI